MTSDTLVQINGTDLIQVLLNLAINGFQSTSEAHTVDIHGKILTAPVELTAIPDGPHDRFLNRDGFKNTLPLVELTVQDDGPGVPPDLMEKIFQPYFSTKPPNRGTGLGLSIVQRLVKEARGGLHLHSELGKGTTFRLYLPAWAMTTVR